MPNYRLSRVNEDMRRELTDVLRNVKDPRVSSGLLTVLRVDVTNDFSYAKVYVSAMEGGEKTDEAVKGLKNAAGYVRSELARRMKNMRKMPELVFVADHSTKRFFELDSLIKSVLPEEGEDTQGTDEGDETP